jgi:phenylacetate-coenzyme A ligase PaaK-like adenylate-forming protein
MDYYQVVIEHIPDEEWREVLLQEYLDHLKKEHVESHVKYQVIYLPFYRPQANMEVC